MTVVVEIFTSPTCVYCPGAKKVLEEVTKDSEDILVFEHSSATQEGRQRAQEFGISSVPTIFVSSPGNKEILAFQGIPSKNKLAEAISKRS